MSNIKISELDSVETLTTDALVTVVQDDGAGALKTFKGTVGDLLALVPTPSGGTGDIPAFGEPGASAFLQLASNAAEALKPGDTTDGGGLMYSGVSNGDIPVASYSVRPSGTWECRGYCGSQSPSVSRSTLFTRIDQVAQTQQNVQSLEAGELTRNFKYANAENTAVTCELFFRNKWHSFTASEDDGTWWGKAIFEHAVAGDFGTIEPFTE